MALTIVVIKNNVPKVVKVSERERKVIEKAYEDQKKTEKGQRMH